MWSDDVCVYTIRALIDFHAKPGSRMNVAICFSHPTNKIFIAQSQNVNWTPNGTQNGIAFEIQTGKMFIIINYTYRSHRSRRVPFFWCLYAVVCLHSVFKFRQIIYEYRKWQFNTFEMPYKHTQFDRKMWLFYFVGDGEKTQFLFLDFSIEIRVRPIS